MVNNRKEFLNKIYHEVPINKTMSYQPKELLKVVTNYLRQNKLFMGDIKEIKVTNGVLYFNNKIVDRICEKDVKTYDEESYYWEGKILEHAEVY